MKTIIRTVGLTAALVLAAGLAQAQHQEHGMQQHDMAQPADHRELVHFPPELAAHTLSNMRDHLFALQEINEALGRGQPDKAAQIAEERLGMSSMKLHGAHEIAKYMPQGMQEAGGAMHRAASRFAIEAQNASVTGDLKPALAALGAVMNGCVSCHAGYRLR